MADLAERLRELDLSGIAVITGPGGVEFEECFGLADRAAGIPVTPATRFGLASVTKMFTAVTVATLGWTSPRRWSRCCRSSGDRPRCAPT